jgi:FAD/FMN-containing dehydrogenase
MADLRATLPARIAAIVGDANVLANPDEQAPFLVDWRGRFRGRALLVVRPGTTDEVSRVVAACAEARVAIVPQGGNTGLCGGATPSQSGDEIVLSLARMNRVRAIDADNATITVEAGVPLATMQSAAADCGLYFPLSLASEGSATIGGNLSTNAGGTAVLRFGNARELTLGLEVVLADGRVLSALRGLRKDNTGYDLKQLFIGGEGTLGIVTAAVLKLFPTPTQRATALATVRDAQSAVSLLRELKTALGDRLTGFELMSDVALGLSLRHHPVMANPLPSSPWYVLVQADDSAPGVAPGVALGEDVETALAHAAGSNAAGDAVIAQSVEQARDLWALRENISEAQRREGPNLKHDISLPVSAIPSFLAEAEAALVRAAPGIRFVIFGHLGDGNLHYNLSAPEGVAPESFVAQSTSLTRIVHDMVDRYGGSISAEHGVGQLKRDEIARYKPAVEIELMRRIKRALDPAGILNPGKVI